MKEQLLKLSVVVFYALAIMLIFLFSFINAYYFPLKSVFDLGINPVYLWLIMFLVSFCMIPYFIIIKKNFRLLGDELYQEKVPVLYSFSATASVVPAMFALFNFIFTQNLLISVVLMVYGVVLWITTYYLLKKALNNEKGEKNIIMWDSKKMNQIKN